jgi:hypothetical protein
MTETTLPKINYTGNSNKDRVAAAQAPVEEKTEKRIPKIEGISATTQKKPLGRRIADMFNPTDMKSIGALIFTTVVIPAAKDMFFDAIKEGSSRAIYGESSGRRVGNGPVGNIRKPQTSYGSVFRSGASNLASRIADDERRTLSDRARSTHDFGQEILIADRGDAEEALLNLDGLIKEYGTASVADLYQMVEVTPSFTDHRWGWDNIADARVRHTRGGYVLDLPPTKELQ